MPEDSKLEDEILLNENILSKKSDHKQPTSEGKSELSHDIPDVGTMTPEAQQYILDLQARLASYKKVESALHCMHFIFFFSSRKVKLHYD